MAAVLPSFLLVWLFGLCQLAYHCGWRINLSRSMPTGVYKVVPVSSTSNLTRGDLVTFCLPNSLYPTSVRFLENGQCSSGKAPFLKQIIATPGDFVEMGQQGLVVNGVIIKHSACVPTLHCHLFKGFLLENRYWVFGSGNDPEVAAYSFDSRYFGPIKSANVLEAAIPKFY